MSRVLVVNIFTSNKSAETQLVWTHVIGKVQVVNHSAVRTPKRLGVAHQPAIGLSRTLQNGHRMGHGNEQFRQVFHGAYWLNDAPPKMVWLFRNAHLTTNEIPDRTSQSCLLSELPVPAPFEPALI
jgi:hypothetical protein